MDISLIVNIVFFASVGLILIFALIGLVKGLWKTLFATLIQAVLMVVSVFAAPAVGRLIGGFNLASLGDFGGLTIGGSTIQISSIRQTICDVIASLGLISPVQGQTIYQAALAVTDILLSLVSYLVMCLLSILLSWILASLLYHTLVKWFIPRRIRLKHPLRPLGALSGAVMGLFASTLAIAPLSSVVNFTKKNTAALNNLSQKGYLPSELMDMITQVQESPYGQGWLFGIDDSMLTTATTVRFGGKKISISDLLNLISGISGPFTAALNSTDAADRFNYTLLLSPTESINVIFDALIDSNLIMGLMPALCQAAVTMVSDSSTIDLSSIDFQDIDFSDELTSIKDAYNQLYSTGVFDNLIGGDIKNISFTQDDRDAVVAALRDFGSMEIISRNMPSLMLLSAKYVQSATGYTILSMDQSKYEGIDWGEELATLGNVAFDLADAADIDLSLSAFTGETSILDQVMEAMNDDHNVAMLREALVGDESKGVSGLLGMQIVSRGVLDYSQVSSLLFTRVPTLAEYIDQSQFTDVLDTLTPEQLKSDVGIIVDILPDVRTLAKESNNETGNWTDISIDFENERQMDAIKSALRKASGSVIISDVLPLALGKSLPSILNKLLGQSSFLGLSASSFDLTGGPSFFDDLISFLDVAPDIKGIVDSMTAEGSTADKIASIDPESFSRVLKALVNSQVFNPDRIVKGNIVSNTNLVTLLNSVIDQFGLADLGFSLPENAQDIDWEDEADRLADILSTFQENIDILSPEGGVDISKVTSDGLEDLVNSVSRSELLSSSLSQFLETQISPRAEEMLGLRLSFEKFKDIEGWTQAAAALGDIWDLAYPFLNDIDIDYKNLDYEYVNALITALFSSGFIPESELAADGTYTDPFGSFIYGLIDKAGVFEQLGMAPNISSFWSIDRDTGDSLEWDWVGETGQVEVSIPGRDEPFLATVSSNGEIAYLCSALHDIQGVDFSNIKESLDSDQVYNILNDLDNSHLGSSLLSGALSSILDNLGNIDVGSGAYLDFSDINFPILYELDDDARKKEFKNISTIYGYAVSDGLTSAFSLETLTHWDQATQIQSGTDEEGNPKYISVHELLESMLDIAVTSSLFNTFRDGYEATFTAQVMAVAYHVSRLGQISMGYGSALLTGEDVEERAIFESLVETCSALSAEQLGQEKDMLITLLALVQSTECFDLTELMNAPAQYITPSNIHYVVGEIFAPMLKDLARSLVVGSASLEFEKILLEQGGMITMIQNLNTDCSQIIPTTVDIEGLDLEGDALDGEIDSLFGMFTTLLDISGAESLDQVFVELIPEDLTELITKETLNKLEALKNAISQVKALSIYRVWIMRGVYNAAKVTYNGTEYNLLNILAEGFSIEVSGTTYTIYEGERKPLGLDATTDPYMLITVNDIVFNRDILIPEIILDFLGWDDDEEEPTDPTDPTNPSEPSEGGNVAVVPGE